MPRPSSDSAASTSAMASSMVGWLPLAPAVKNYGVTQLPQARINRLTGQHDLCFVFTQAAVDPFWVLDAVQLVGLADASGGAHSAAVAHNR